MDLADVEDLFETPFHSETALLSKCRGQTLDDRGSGSDNEAEEVDIDEDDVFVTPFLLEKVSRIDSLLLCASN